MIVMVGVNLILNCPNFQKLWDCEKNPLILVDNRSGVSTRDAAIFRCLAISPWGIVVLPQSDL